MSKPIQVQTAQTLPLTFKYENRFFLNVAPEFPDLSAALIDHAEFVHLPLARRDVEIQLDVQIFFRIGLGDRLRSASAIELAHLGNVPRRRIAGRRVCLLGQRLCDAGRQNHTGQE